MPAPSSRRAPARPLLSKSLKRTFAFFAAAFAALFAVGAAHLHFATLGGVAQNFSGIVMAVGLGVACIAAALCWRTFWHAFANHCFLSSTAPVENPWVIDGDTIDDRARGVRYRIANIDAPEIDGAKCYRESARGQLAKWALVRLVRDAHIVAVRPTFRTDRYGRRVAFVLADGQDVGNMLVARGLAVPWRGWRRAWCGPRGGLAKIAKAGAMAHACKTCGALG